TCAKYSRAYLCHLIRAKEMSGATLISIHNVRFLIRQAQLCRQAIIEGRFKEYFLEFAANMGKELGT
ncbi:MAG: tRNA-guanine transglycosylase, partial [Cyanobacteria bacterium HKST-UBA01]|nr:tRNA-guanine transglycosylase [Cyanobacteria bacterium HKST-UBA01]